MQITEIFRSIQGESTYVGTPCIFVRLTGCNLRCVWCDTAYAFYGGQRKSVEEAVVSDVGEPQAAPTRSVGRKLRYSRTSSCMRSISARKPETAAR